MMKLYYQWRLKKIHAEIHALKKSVDSPLTDNYYMDHSRLRSLTVLAERLQQQLGESPTHST
jgi:hypothetical protein